MEVLIQSAVLSILDELPRRLRKRDFFRQAFFASLNILDSQVLIFHPLLASVESFVFVVPYPLDLQETAFWAGPCFCWRCVPAAYQPRRNLASTPH